jgi:polysaccharide pyruvyl transferase
VKVWAWSGGVRNFGDELGPVILERLGHDVERVPTMEEADVLACGSLLEDAAANAKPGTVVWGSGLMFGDTADLSHLDVRAVRGRLTLRACGLMPDVVTVDPGALVPQLWPKPATRRDLGVVRHYVDENLYPWADATIDATAPVDEVIDFIGSCRRVASSSLHGLIVAHAWLLPTLRLPHPDVAGGDFKWADWLSGLHDPRRLVELLP